MKKINPNMKAGILFIIISLVFLSPIIADFSKSGLQEWEQEHARYEAARITILRYHQFPFWNPYFCGGTVMLGDVQNSFLSPFFILALIFGSVAGIKLFIILNMMLGMYGFYRLSKYLKISDSGAILGAIVFMLNGYLAFQLATGARRTALMSLIPWIFLFFMKSDDKKYLVWSSILLGILFLEGSVYILAFTMVMLGVYILVKWDKKVILRYAIICALMVGLAAVKLLPALDFYHSYDRYTASEFEISPDVLIQTLINPGYESHYDFMSRARWEYMAFIGIIPFLLALIGMFKAPKHFLIMLAAAVLLYWRTSSFGLFNLLHKLPVFNMLQITSRTLPLIIFFIAIMAAFGFDAVSRKAASLKKKKWQFYSNAILILLIVFVAVNLTQNNSALLRKTFSLENPPSESSEFYQNMPVASTITVGSLYQSVRANTGNLDCGLNFKPYIPPDYVKSASYENYKGEIYTSDGPSEFVYWSPNKIEFEPSQHDIIINMNYYEGWRSDAEQVSSSQGLMQASPGATKVFYRPPLFIIGLIITLSTIILMTKIYKLPKKYWF